MKKISYYLVYILIFFGCDLKLQNETSIEVEPNIIQITQNKKQKSDLTWSPEGDKIAFTQYSEGMFFTRYSNTGENLGLVLRKDFFIHYSSLSPAGNRLAYVKNGIRVVSLEDNSEIQLLPNSKHRLIYEPIWSPDGEWIAFSSSTDDFPSIHIYLIPSSGGEIRHITKDDTSKNPSYFCSSFSRDGNDIILFSYRSGNAELWTVSIESGELKQLTFDGTIQKRYPVWSPNGLSIIYQTSSPADGFRSSAFWILRPSNGYVKKLNEIEGYGEYFAWAPDNKTVAMSVFIKNSGLWLITSWNGEMTRIVEHEQIYNPDWLPDGKTLIAARLDHFTNIRVVTLSNHDIQNLTSGEFGNGESNSSWFRDNSQFIFLRENQIWQGDVFGNKFFPLITDTTIVKFNMKISHEGSQIIFDNGVDIFLQKITDPNPVNLTEHIDEKLTQPTLAPDGKRVACTSRYGIKIYLIYHKKLIEEKVITGDYTNPNWSPHNKDLRSHLAVENASALYIISPHNWQPQLVIYEGHEPCWSPDGKKIAFLKDKEIFVAEVFKNL